MEYPKISISVSLLSLGSIPSACFGKEAYRFANNEPIKVFARDKAIRHEVEVSGLHLCTYCSQILANELENEIHNSTDFVEFLKQAEGIDPNSGK